MYRLKPLFFFLYWETENAKRNYKPGSSADCGLLVKVKPLASRYNNLPHQHMVPLCAKRRLAPIVAPFVCLIFLANMYWGRKHWQEKETSFESLNNVSSFRLSLH